MELGIFHLACAGIFISAVYLFKNSQTFRFYVKTGFYYINGMCFAIVMIPVGLCRPKNVANLRIAFIYLDFVHKLLGFNFIKRNCQALKNCSEPAILILNHQRAIHLSPLRSTFLAKKELLYAGFFGISSWLNGLVFIDRLNRDKSLATMERTVKHIIEDKIKLWVFPEGTRGNQETLLPFRKGAFHLAIQAQVPIYPVVFSSYKHFLDTKRKIFNPGKVIVSGLPPVPTKGLTIEDTGELMERVRNQMATEFNKITKEVREEAKFHGESILED